ncbi:MAG: iron ABC transporter permease [Desulfomonile tiedjei]|nr:iron ABC transporter permease [Desulfomonile tiedjei]
MLLVLLTLGTTVSILAAAMFGRMEIPALGVFKAIAAGLGLSSGSGQDPVWEKVVFNIRLSRICLSGLVGLTLAAAGAAFQGILRNPLADPFTIGVSTGAAFGASLAIFLGLGGQTYLGMGFIPLAALAGALAALFTVIALARINRQLRPETMVLAGIVVATFLAALISLIKSLDEESVSSIVFWVMGSFQGRGWNHVAFALPYMAAGLVLIGLYSRELDLLSLGGVQARQLGVNVDRVRLRILIGASLLTAGAVSVSGVIGFVGLVIPHLVRMAVGADHRPLLILSGLLGAVALIWSDVAARVLLPGGEELPVGVVTALLGGPFFCLLLKWRKERGGLD